MNKSKPAFARILILALGAFAATGTAVTNANACGGEWYPFMQIEEEEIDHRPMAVARAEKAVEEGKLKEAAGMILRAMPHIRTLNPEKAKIVERAQRVLAVATIRQDGAATVQRELPRQGFRVSRAHFMYDSFGFASSAVRSASSTSKTYGAWLGESVEDRQANLQWAVDSLNDIAETKKDDPALQTEIAEGLARLGRDAEARETLERLAAKDLIATPEGWAALAQLRAGAGDETGKLAALKRCTSMAQSPEICAHVAS